MSETAYIPVCGFRCMVCKKVFVYVASLMTHVRQTHDLLAKMSDSGVMRANQSDDVTRPIAINNADPKFSCSICGNWYNLKRSLARHQVMFTPSYSPIYP
jgi:hypothetical protein